MSYQPDYKCIRCKHPGSQHFEAEDSIGYYAFCMLEKCDCFIDDHQEKNEKKNRPN